MRKMFLTSTGLPPETASYFLELLEKDPKETKVAFIPTVADPENNKWFVDEARNQLKSLSFPFYEVDLKEPPANIRKKLEKANIVFINGGNTFYLLDWVRKSGLDKYLGNLIDNGKIYIGSSAGSILVGPDISVSGWDESWDKNIVNLQDLSGLKLVPFAVSPHFTEEEREILERKSKEVSYNVLPITDTQAVLIEGKNYKIVGKGEIIKLYVKNKILG